MLMFEKADALSGNNWPAWGYSLPNMAIVQDFEDSLLRFIKEAEAGGQGLQFVTLNLARQALSAPGGKENDATAGYGISEAAPASEIKPVHEPLKFADKDD